MYYELTGAVAPVAKNPAYPGEKRWRKKDQSTKRVIRIQVMEHRAWLTAWEQKNGKCSRCAGTGKTIASVSVREGTTYRTCGACNGSGKPSETQPKL